MLELATKRILKLVTVARLFDTLHEQEIIYCHWKSNEHLKASMQGQTDLDVLFDANQKLQVESVLHQVGFKRFDTIKEKSYRDIVDFLALDLETGKLIHLHTHYRLTIGEPYLKGFQFNSSLEASILENRVFDETYGIFCIQPASELILLYIRHALKLRRRDLLFGHFRQNPFVLREYRWLRSMVTDEEIHQALETIFNFPELTQFITGEFRAKNLSRIASAIKRGSKVKRLYSPIQSHILRWYREAAVMLFRNLTCILHRPVLSKRINPRGGLVVAVIGADGSGKSTITENLRKTFEVKLDVFKIYFGRGDGKASESRRLLTSFKVMYRNTKTGKGLNGQKCSSVKKDGFFRTLHKTMEALFVAQEKRQNLKFMERAKRKGALVICDRFPQNQIMGYNDGPLLHKLQDSKNPVLRSVGKIESVVYQESENHPADILFKLIAEADVVEKRKPGETSIEKLRSKIDGIKSLQFKNDCKVVTVDAAKPLEEVLYLIRKEIWNML